MPQSKNKGMIEIIFNVTLQQHLCFYKQKIQFDFALAHAITRAQLLKTKAYLKQKCNLKQKN